MTWWRFTTTLRPSAISSSHFAQLSPQVEALKTCSLSNLTSMSVLTPPERESGVMLPSTGLSMTLAETTSDLSTSRIISTESGFVIHESR